MRDCGRVFPVGLSQNTSMTDDAWRTRLEDAVTADGRSLRQISLDAGLSEGYLHGILRNGKEPTLDRFIRICSTLHISTAYALMGAKVAPETEAIIAALESDPRTRDAVLALLGREDAQLR